MEPAESDHEKERIERLRRAMYSRTLSEKLKERPRREMDEIRPVVGEDWKHEEPQLASTLVAPRTLQLARKSLWWALAVAVVFFVGAMAFFAYYFTLGGGSSPASAANIDIVISGPSQVAGGEPTELQIAVTNRNQVPLQLAELVINYPLGTRSPTDLSTDLSSQRISLGTIEPGGRRQGTVSAVFAGSGSEIDVKVDLEYRLEGSSAIFVATNNYQTMLSSSSLTLTVEANTETISGQPVEFTVTVASNANMPVRDVLLSAGYPFGFTLSAGEPQPTRAAEGGGHVWELGDIAPGAKRQVTLRGTLVGESGDERVFRFSAGTRTSPDEPNITTRLAESSFRMKVSDVFLGLSISINKSAGGSVVVSPGSLVNVAVNWQNNLPAAIQDAVIVARLSGIQIDGSTVISPDGFFRSSDGVVIWDKTTTRGTFSNLATDARGAVSFSFRVPAGDALKNVRNPTLTITVNAAGKRLSESGVPENLQAATSQKIAVASDLTVAAQGLYYANPFGSSGPLPPKAGTETTYAIVFTITNTTNKINETKLTAVLPSYVRWTGIYSPASESVSFNQTNSTVTWDVGTVEAGVGVDGTQPRQAAISIGFTPSPSQIGQEPPLLQDIKFTGVDASTDAEVSRTVPNVTTNILGDPGFSATNATVVR